MTSGISTGTTRIIRTSAADGTITLSKPVISIANGDSFQIGPRVTVDSYYTGRGFLGIGNVNGSGNLTSVTILNTGSGYANSDMSFDILGSYHATASGKPDGTGAVVDIIIPPMSGGHGFSAASSLKAKYVIVSAETVLPLDDQTGVFAGPRNEIRQIGLLRNPEDARTARLARDTSYDLRTTLYFEHPTGTIPYSEDDEVVSQKGKGIIWDVGGTSNKQFITLTNVTGSFITGDTITVNGSDPLIISDVSLDQHSYPVGSNLSPDSPVMSRGLTKYSGQIIYHENITPISRRSNQKENFKFVFEF